MPDVQAAVDQQLQVDRRLAITAKKMRLLSDRQAMCQDESLFASKFKLDLNWTNVWDVKTQRYSQTDFGIYVVRGRAKRNIKPGFKKNRGKHKATEKKDARTSGKRKFSDEHRVEQLAGKNERKAVENSMGV